jgi:hypothetical protein
VPKIELERAELEYTHISPYYLNKVAQAERARYIKDELDGVEPKAPTYTIAHGGGSLPGGRTLEQWEQSYDYTDEYIAELREEYDGLKRQGELTVERQARFVDLHNTLDEWDAYVEVVSGLGAAIREKRYMVGLWRMFGHLVPENDDWIARQEEDGIDVGAIPDGERERFLYWLETELVATQQEFNDLILAVEGRDELMKEARRVSRAMFQRAVGEE